MNRIAIIGGGPGGLMSAYFLEKLANSPLDITLFEASDRLGGKIITPTFESVPARYEAGAAEFYDYSHFGEDPLKELIAELGLSISPMGGSAVIMHDQLLTNAEDIQEQFGAKTCQELRDFDRRARDLMIPDEFYHSDHPEGTAQEFSQQSLSELLDTVGDRKAREFIETLIHSDLATESHQTHAPYGLQNYLMNDPDYMLLYGIVGGNEQLPLELARRIQARCLLNHKIASVEHNGQRYHVVAQNLEGTFREEFDIVIVALPHNLISGIEFLGEALASSVHSHQEHYDHPAHYLRITILFEKPFWRTFLTDSFWMLDQLGGCCLYDESLRQPGGDHGILGWLLGGDTALKMCEWDDEELIEVALQSLPSVLAEGRKFFLEGKVHRWESAVNAMPGGRVQVTHDLRHQPDPLGHPQLFFVGDYLFDTTLNGVLDSAYYVAGWVSAQLLEEC